ncbi:hypothetical protein Hanom_Chr12g01084211 [Helianthus anomalus]
MQPPVVLNFLNTRPPPNYVAGFGRGLPDIGPAPDLDDYESVMIQRLILCGMRLNMKSTSDAEVLNTRQKNQTRPVQYA